MKKGDFLQHYENRDGKVYFTETNVKTGAKTSYAVYDNTSKMTSSSTSKSTSTSTGIASNNSGSCMPGCSWTKDDPIIQILLGRGSGGGSSSVSTSTSTSTSSAGRDNSGSSSMQGFDRVPITSESFRDNILRKGLGPRIATKEDLAKFAAEAGGNPSSADLLDGRGKAYDGPAFEPSNGNFRPRVDPDIALMEEVLKIKPTDYPVVGKFILGARALKNAGVAVKDAFEEVERKGFNELSDKFSVPGVYSMGHVTSEPEGKAEHGKAVTEDMKDIGKEALSYVGGKAAGKVLGPVAKKVEEVVGKTNMKALELAGDKAMEKGAEKVVDAVADKIENPTKENSSPNLTSMRPQSAPVVIQGVSPSTGRASDVSTSR